MMKHLYSDIFTCARLNATQLTYAFNAHRAMPMASSMLSDKRMN
ncbi:hypothetical protein [Vibrio sp.]|nr:hypothetical protein [Vibrio sp.]